MKVKKTSKTKLVTITERYKIDFGGSYFPLKFAYEYNEKKPKNGKIHLTIDNPPPLFLKRHWIHIVKDIKAFKRNVLKTNPFHNNINQNDFYSPYEVYEKVINNKLNKSSIVFVDNGGQKLFDGAGKIIPICEHYSYIGTPFISSRSWLLKLHEHCKKLKDFEVSDIKVVPYYNNDSGNDKYFDVKIRPSKSIAEDAWHKALSSKGGVEFTSVRYRELLIGLSYEEKLKDFDPYGLQKFEKIQDEEEY